MCLFVLRGAHEIVCNNPRRRGILRALFRVNTAIIKSKTDRSIEDNRGRQIVDSVANIATRKAPRALRRCAPVVCRLSALEDKNIFWLGCAQLNSGLAPSSSFQGSQAPPSVCCLLIVLASVQSQVFMTRLLTVTPLFRELNLILCSLWLMHGLFQVVKELAFGQRKKYHGRFQFLWMDEMETVSSIAMSFLASPSLVALRTSDHLYYMPAGVSTTTVPELAAFLDRVAAGDQTAYGGTSFLMRVRRLLFDIVSTIVSIWQASRWLFLLMFGLPTTIISIICYSLCCLETIDDGPVDSDEEEDEDGEGSHSRLYDGPPPPLTFSQTSSPPSYDSVTSGGADLKDVDAKKNE
ncbi:hypothetical protein RRG08_000148 [Elysia crispata]|uniref:Uncharacterized protein n=1 Tax=Elysia crispata TaxID=231223 RepID=A0AAE1D5W8_9GAST|nr:hypothetical protein RRG08_000148 [Elysia crispata]